MARLNKTFLTFDAPPHPKLTSQVGGRRGIGSSRDTRTRTPPNALSGPMETQTQAVSFACLNVKDHGGCKQNDGSEAQR